MQELLCAALSSQVERSAASSPVVKCSGGMLAIAMLLWLFQNFPLNEHYYWSRLVRRSAWGIWASAQVRLGSSVAA